MVFAKWKKSESGFNSVIIPIESEVFTHKVPQLFGSKLPAKPSFLASRKWFNRLNLSLTGFTLYG